MFIAIRRKDPGNQLALFRLTGHDRRSGSAPRGCSLECIQSQLRFPGLLIRPVAVIAVFGQNRPDITPEVGALVRHYCEWPEEKN